MTHEPGCSCCCYCHFSFINIIWTATLFFATLLSKIPQMTGESSVHIHFFSLFFCYRHTCIVVVVVLVCSLCLLLFTFVLPVRVCVCVLLFVVSFSLFHFFSSVFCNESSAWCSLVVIMCYITILVR